jgi:hypothetical protein
LLAACSWDIDDALQVLWCESRYRSGEVANGNYGGFQINAIHAERVGGNLDLLLIPEVNVRVACDIWLDQGWGPWACKPDG